jgi:hypothetical protein
VQYSIVTSDFTRASFISFTLCARDYAVEAEPLLFKNKVLAMWCWSCAVFVKFELIEDAIPSVVEVEDRHVEYQERIMHSPTAREQVSPSVL